MPFNAQLIIGIPNGASDIISPNIINSGILDINNLVIENSLSYHQIDLSKNDLELLKLSDKIILKLIFNTADPANHIDLYDNYKINFKISSSFNASINIQ